MILAVLISIVVFMIKRSCPEKKEKDKDKEGHYNLAETASPGTTEKGETKGEFAGTNNIHAEFDEETKK